MLLSKVVEIKWNQKNRTYYENKGYKFTKYGDSFEIDVDDISKASKAIVEVKCDFCNNVIVKKAHQTYVKQHNAKYGDCCASCQPKKNKLVCLDKYGVDNGSKTQSAIDKIKETSMNRYGVENPAQSEGVREKIRMASLANADSVLTKRKQTIIERYGVESIMDLEFVKEKQRQTLLNNYGVEHPKQSDIIKERERLRNIEKYGCEYPSQTTEVKDKMKETCLEKYGVEYSLSAPEVREKINNTLLANGTVKTSKQQLQLQQLLKDIYGECELNKPCGTCLLDCAIIVNEIQIDVEYDGWYWHQDVQRDRRRDEFVKTQGYKILRIKGNYKIPTKEQLIQHITELVNSNHTFDVINLV